MKELLNLQKEQTMSSREIAEYTGKQHAHVMESIRNMADAWERVGQSKFRLTYYTDQWNRQQPQYELTKRECLYVATKYNDEARAKLIIRWEELEKQNHLALDFSNPKIVLQLAQNWAREQELRLIAEAKNEADAPKVLFTDAVIGSKSSCLIGELAKIITQNGYEIGQNRLFKWLRENGYLGTRGENYNIPHQQYIEQGLFELKKGTRSGNDGVMHTTITPKVTGKGQVYFVNKFLKAS